MSDNDDAFIDSVPINIINAYRDSMFTAAFILQNPTMFLNTNWVDASRLREFMAKREIPSTGVHVKEEEEVIELSSAPLVPATVPRIRTITEDNHETILILDSDEEVSDPELNPVDLSSSQDGSFDWDSDYLREPQQDDDEESEERHSQSDESSNLGDPLSSDWDIRSISDDDNLAESDVDIVSVHEDNMESEEWVDSDTVWLDEDITSQVLNKHRLERIVGGFPSYYPVPRVSTAYLLDASDEKYQGQSIDKLIADKEQESWLGASGLKDSKPKLSIFTGDKTVCIRKRQRCSGVYACNKLDPSYINVERYELNPETLKKLIQEQIESRIVETDSIDKKTLVFWNVINSSHCRAVDDAGAPCNGRPIMKPLKVNHFFSGRDWLTCMQEKRDGFSYFIACSNWSSEWSSNHRSFSISSGVSELSLSKLFHDETLSGISAVATCTRILPARIGGKVKICGYPHNADGQQSKMVKIECKAYRTIFYPANTSIRQACIIYQLEKPHTHPILPASKASLEVREMYRRCVLSSGLVGKTVRSVDSAPSTNLLLQGQPSALIHPSMINRRQKEKIVREEKQKRFPQGLGTAGVWTLYEEDIRKPDHARYVHRITSSLTGGKLIFTFKTRLLDLIHTTLAFEVDGTFKRVVGEFDEVEITIWHAGVSRAVTIGRVYITRKDTETYKCLFDNLQELVQHLTQKPMRFKALSHEGNLLALGTDMELALIQGAGQSFLKTNEPEYSNIHTDDPEEIVKYFLRICLVHCKRGIQCFDTPDLKEEFARLKNFMYLSSDTEIEEFTAWVNGLKKNDKTKAIQGMFAWWKDKLKPYILSGILKCRSNMSDTAWAVTPTTTNINEMQHKFTNEHTGIKTTIVEAILLAYDLDTKVEEEVYSSLEHGILKNPHNTSFHRLGRNLNRRASKAQKKTEAREHDHMLDSLRSKISNLKEELRVKSGKPSRARRPQPAQSSSSGRVSAAKSKATIRMAAAPYQLPAQSVGNENTTDHSNSNMYEKLPNLPADHDFFTDHDLSSLPSDMVPMLEDQQLQIRLPLNETNPYSTDSTGTSWERYDDFLYGLDRPRPGPSNMAAYGFGSSGVGYNTYTSTSSSDANNFMYSFSGHGSDNAY
ncbi:hypothetical protein C8R42DRAFT_724623 [Lentinula raphanica]|nr:hypothetical protein C8R42DRAFT_724623 [Lentinula raphanica]